MSLSRTADRSRLMAFGSTTILFGEHTTWDALVEQSLLVKRSTSTDLKLGPTKELGRYPRIPYAVAVTSEGLTRAPTVVDAHEAARQTNRASPCRQPAQGDGVVRPRLQQHLQDAV
jgi:hypothetical protein